MSEPEQELIRAHGRIASLTDRNERLVQALRESRDQLVALKREVDNLSALPHSYGVFVDRLSQDHVRIFAGGRMLATQIAPGLAVTSLRRGQVVELNENYVVMGSAGFERTGEVMTVAQLLGPDRLGVVDGGGRELIVYLAQTEEPPPLRQGDFVLVASGAPFAYPGLERSALDPVLAARVPQVEWADIGGLDFQVTELRRIVGAHLSSGDLGTGLQRRPRGVLVHGPSGCGKTMILHSLATSLERARQTSGEAMVSVLYVRCSALPTKYVGDTEERMRLIFSRARDYSTDTVPVVVILDSLECLSEFEGANGNTDAESTRMLAELAVQFEALARDKVLVVGATNAPARLARRLLRPNAFSVTLHVGRPDRDALRDIVRIGLRSGRTIEEENRSDASDAIAAAIADLFCERTPRTALSGPKHTSDGNEPTHLVDILTGAMVSTILCMAVASARAAVNSDPQELMGAVATEVERLRHLTSADHRISAR